MSRKLIRKLQIGFGISLLILLVSSSASYVSIKNQMNNRGQVIHTQQTIEAANQILIDLQNAETGQRGYLLTGKASFLAPYYESLRSLPRSIAEARSLTKDDPQQLRRIDSVDQLVNKQLIALNEHVSIKSLAAPS
ncbi:CHASE3 domain-containing protein [Niabella ginsengisoli]|uniref:CHASE3 domain-containing protein n=1 Tax=Niabella ginsengisoli TaxID=522298 RepID=A0ABS9SIR6_9BACT|nr:CHASE3 domain-containing protein [Niabella ginsengisoli]MCH5598258.1 CHASE3 domain-containing protein [Niabella ginsengisoli]